MLVLLHQQEIAVAVDEAQELHAEDELGEAVEHRRDGNDGQGRHDLRPVAGADHKRDLQAHQGRGDIAQIDDGAVGVLRRADDEIDADQPEDHEAVAKDAIGRAIKANPPKEIVEDDDGPERRHDDEIVRACEVEQFLVGDQRRDGRHRRVLEHEGEHDRHRHGRRRAPGDQERKTKGERQADSDAPGGVREHRHANRKRGEKQSLKRVGRDPAPRRRHAFAQ